MKKLSFISLLGLLTLGLHAQNLTDAQGKKQGDWIQVYNGTDDVRYTGQFKDDQPYGMFQYYYFSGQKSAEVRFYENGKVSISRAFHDNGQLMAEGKYIEQKKDSIWNYYSRSGSLSNTEKYKNGKLSGTSETYYANGSPAERTTWLKGVKHGSWSQNFDNGQIKAEAEYVNGQPEGEMLFYYPNGKKEIQGKMTNGDRDGSWKYYNEDGSLQMQLLYQQGKVVQEKKENGVFKEYFHEDIPKSVHNYKQGMKNGPFLEYYDQGKWEVVERPEGPKGEPAENVRVLKGQQVRRSGKYQSDLLEGKVRYFHENGVLKKTEIYEAGVLLK